MHTYGLAAQRCGLLIGGNGDNKTSAACCICSYVLSFRSGLVWVERREAHLMWAPGLSWDLFFEKAWEAKLLGSLGPSFRGSFWPLALGLSNEL